jgi:toxin secretion/phage lysis holin
VTNILSYFGLPPDFLEVIFSPYHSGPIGTTLSNFANANPLLAALFGFIIFDVLSGLFASAKAGQLASPISFAGMMKKAEELTVVAAFHLLEWLLFRAFNQPWPLAGTIMWGFIFYELISILENADRSGLPLPPWLKPLMASMKQKTEIANLATITGLMERWGMAATAPASVTIAPNADHVEVNTPAVVSPSPYYVVKPNDTLAGIAAQYAISVEALAVANSLEVTATLLVGQPLIIPVPGQVAAPPVKEGVTSAS